LELTDDGHLDTIKYCQIDNTLDGFYARFFRDGTLWSIEYYKNGKKHGLVQKWGVSGELTYIANYCEGVPIGIHLDFKSGGLELFDKKTYHDGKLIEHQKFMFDVDKQFCLSRYKDGERHGINEYFDYESQKYISYMYIDGERLEETREMRDCFD
jgi:antitoxin component YwqK of YwqJK toxin-antitoxin module